ncbi:MAG: hypothetical protein AAF603_01095, partial [Pseudomonadota bacterium]
KSIADCGGHALLSPPTTVKGRLINGQKYGRVGEATSIYKEGISQTLQAGAIPLISCLGQDEEGRVLNINADAIAREVARAMRPLKIVFLTSTGGLLDQEQRIIDTINLISDYDHLIKEHWVEGGMQLKLEQIKLLLDDLPPSTSVSMTNVPHMMKELFTHGGAGTLIRQGERILSGAVADQEKLTSLISEAFGKTLHASYWDKTDIDHVIYTERYRAAAVITQFDGIPCLDKFAVSKEARGEGLAKAVWRELQQRSPQLIWRSRITNPFSGFYMSVADGFIRQGPWFILWYGEGLEDHIFPLAKKLGAKQPDFESDDA